MSDEIPYDLSADELRKLVSYNPETGEWTRLSGRKAGKKAGYIDINRGYEYVYIADRQRCAHQLAWLWMNGYWPRHGIDHIDENKSNNRWSNLRKADKSQNGANRGAQRNNKSTGIKGVYPSGDRYRTSIALRGKQIYLGTFDTIDEAAEAYRQAAERLHGEFAKF